MITSYCNGNSPLQSSTIDKLPSHAVNGIHICEVFRRCGGLVITAATQAVWLHLGLTSETAVHLVSSKWLIQTDSLLE